MLVLAAKLSSVTTLSAADLGGLVAPADQGVMAALVAPAQDQQGFVAVQIRALVARLVQLVPLVLRATLALTPPRRFFRSDCRGALVALAQADACDTACSYSGRTVLLPN